MTKTNNPKRHHNHRRAIIRNPIFPATARLRMDNLRIIAADGRQAEPERRRWSTSSPKPTTTRSARRNPEPPAEATTSPGGIRVKSGPAHSLATRLPNAEVARSHHQIKNAPARNVHRQHVPEPDRLANLRHLVPRKRPHEFPQRQFRQQGLLPPHQPVQNDPTPPNRRGSRDNDGKSSQSP